MDRKYPNALAYIKIEAVIQVKQKLWAVKIWAKMIWKQPSSLRNCCNITSGYFPFSSVYYKVKQTVCLVMLHITLYRRTYPTPIACTLLERPEDKTYSVQPVFGLIVS